MIRGVVDVAGGTLAWDRVGEGPPLILLHGFSLDRRMWNAQVATLAEEFSVIRYDLRGFGASSLPDGPYSHVADLETLIGALGLERPALLGLSLGANVALNFALAHPDALSALILASPGLPGFAWTEVRPPDAAAAHARDHGVEAGKAFWLDHPLFAALDDYPEARAEVRRMVGDYHGWHWQNDNPVTDPMDAAARLGAVKAPTLVLSGARDVQGYRAIAAHLADTIPGARLETIAGAGHMLNLERPDEFNPLIQAFLAGRQIDRIAI